ncbi:VWA domain-containing protein [Pelagimonas varians]|uniref:Tetratricopeptide repeat protein n=1 Tax=Pelagimonas varians TaxID=696760 RepID=A0A238KAG4_9RHOB|nr:VWA domain-containing protein [Pelagimonas varians]PYG31010.1 Ca-activated chloride channel family protein [Pelagimonas varians]SMX39414.1 Tetratricopeptide repeat protein [Pelagimonas varians]
MFEALGDWIGVFHFLRPLWLLAILPIGLIWWLLRRRKTKADDPAKGLAPHLAKALTVGAYSSQRITPRDSAAIILLLLAIGAAGPTWTRYPNPLLAQTAPLIVALKVTPSMTNTDVTPTRQTRATFKILDLIARRAGAKTALLAYSGSAHRVTPLTEDPNIIRTYLEGLTPEIMPNAGDRADLALGLAQVELTKSETPGAILVVLDDFNPANVAAFSEAAADRPPVIFFVIGPQASELPQLSGIPNSSIVDLTPDDSDLTQIERRVVSAYRDALLADTSQTWDDRGWLLAWPAALLLLLWFRRGWVVQWVLAFALILPAARPAHAEGWVDWFFTADQQAQRAYNNKDFAEAAELFQDTDWRAYAQFKSGKYEEASETYSFVETADAAIGEGLSHLRNRKYRDGVRAFEKALERDPDSAMAKHNLAVAKAIVVYVENTQSQSATGDVGPGADNTVFDNESGKGQQVQISADDQDSLSTGLTTEDWMRAVDTNVGDFLSTRFRLEQAQGDE